MGINIYLHGVMSLKIQPRRVMTEHQDLVGVVVPMYNAAATIAQTLKSICVQSHRNLDIIVVDDGSTDGSGAIVEAVAEADPRIRLIYQPNSGVAAARNTGAKNTPANLLAFIDADDLWRNDKLEKQLSRLRSEPGVQGSAEIGLVYCWFAQIDDADFYLTEPFKPLQEGKVLRALCRRNFIGNGSSMLLTRKAYEHARGFEPKLRDLGAQGCEDLLIALRVASNFEIALVPEVLVGYRILDNNMSSNAERMLKSCTHALNEIVLSSPDYKTEADLHIRDMKLWLLQRSASCNDLISFFRYSSSVAKEDFFGIVSITPRLISSVLRTRVVPKKIRRKIKSLLGLQRSKFAIEDFSPSVTKEFQPDSGRDGRDTIPHLECVG